MVKSLEEDLKFWRAERPDEWTMDEFIRKAKKLESQNADLLEALEDMLNQGCGEYQKKSCGHNFYCVCPGDKAVAAIAKARGQ